MKTTLFFILILITALSGYFAGVSDTKEAKLNYYIQKQGAGYQITVTDRNGYVGSYEEETLTETNLIINQQTELL